jgi:two-component system response regulator HupR/HoxA
MSERLQLLIVDDEPANLQKLKRTFVQDYIVHEALSGEEALQVLRTHAVAAIITDQRMPGMSGAELLKHSLEVRPDTVRIILTGYTEVEDLMDAINQGHVDRYVTKPWDPGSLLETVRRELERWQLKRENLRLTRELEEANERLARENLRLQTEMEALGDRKSQFVYRSRAMEDLLRLLDRVVKTDSTVLIQGETGTGKELLARYLHQGSQRSAQPFVPVNCGAIPRDLVESAFFGHRKGAFTGATEHRRGFFELADHGTLFLDEVGEAPPELQVKLLRVLQEGEIRPVGSETTRQVDVRIIASTNRNLALMVDRGEFRQDLFFRLNVFSVHVPPLRARKEDIEVLALHFLENACRRLNKRADGFDEETLRRLMEYDWPGNVRELENEIERLVILHEGRAAIPPELLSERVKAGSRMAGEGTLKERLAAVEKEMILRALERCHNNRSQAAELLGITRQTIIAKLKQYRSQAVNSRR